MPRSILLTLLLVSLASTSASALEIVFADHRETRSFQRISEFFTGQENPGRYQIARSVATNRDGFYVSVKANKADPIKIFSSVRMSYVKTASQDIHTVEIPFAGKPKKRFLIGLTDDEWRETDTFPHAWKIEFLNTSGETIDSVQSFLWSFEK